MVQSGGFWGALKRSWIGGSGLSFGNVILVQQSPDGPRCAFLQKKRLRVLLSSVNVCVVRCLGVHGCGGCGTWVFGFLGVRGGGLGAQDPGQTAAHDQ